MQKSTFSVNFFIRRTRLGKSGETPIMMRISVDSRYTELSTQRRVLVEQWSQSRCCATGKTAVALEINRHLDNLRSKARGRGGTEGEEVQREIGRAHV